MAAQFDTSPEVVPNPSAHLPQVYDAGSSPHSGYPYASYISPASDVPPPLTRKDSQARTPPLNGKEAAQVPVPASTAVSEREKKSRIYRCPAIVFILITALAVAVAAVIGLAAATGVAVKKSNDSDAKLNALRESYAAFSDVAAQTSATVTVTNSAAGSTSTGVDEEDLTSGCSNKKDTMTGTVYTSKFLNKANFIFYCNKNAPNDPVFSVFATSLNGCIEACNAWNSYNTTKKTCEGVSFVPFWATIGNAATNNAPGDCYLKPGPLDQDDLQDAKGTHAALLKN